MNRLDKLILLELWPPFLNGISMFLVLLFAAAGLFPATDLIVHGVPLMVVGKIVMYSLPSLITEVLPMAMLLAGLLGFGRMSGDRETVALFAAGITFARMARMVMLMGLLVSIVSFVWNDTVVPPASMAYNQLRQEALKQIRPSEEPISYTINAPGTTSVEEFVSVDGGYDARTRTLRHVTLVRFSRDPRYAGRPELVLYCDRAIAEDQLGLQWRYFDGRITAVTLDPATGRTRDEVTHVFDTLETRTATLGKNFEGVLASEINDPNRLSFRQMQRVIAEQRREGQDTRGMEVDLYGKIALPMASLIFCIVGAALGMSTQRGSSKAMGFGVAIFIVFLYWVMYHAMYVVGKSGGLPPILASFTADIVGVGAGILLTARASR